MGSAFDLTGKRFDKLSVIKLDPIRGNSGQRRWICNCDCGNTISVIAQSLSTGNTTSCGCSRLSHQNLEGQKFGKWTVLNRRPNAGLSVMYFCRCECGTERNVRSSHLMSNRSSSCGCEHPGNVIHGQASLKAAGFTKKYKAWRSMMVRCTVKSSPDYELYKDRFYEPWRDFRVFDRDVPDPLDDNLTLERLKNEKGYEPGNVGWVTMAEQHRNQSNCYWIEFDGKRQLLSDWAKELGIRISTLRDRIVRHGVPIALTMERRN